MSSTNKTAAKPAATPPTKKAVEQSKPAQKPGARSNARKAVAAVPDTPEGHAAYKATLGPKLRVRATQTGFIDNVRRREGDVFDVHEQEFSEVWMEAVDGRTPPKSTGAQAALKAHHDDTLAGRMASKPANADVLG